MGVSIKIISSDEIYVDCVQNNLFYFVNIFVLV